MDTLKRKLDYKVYKRCHITKSQKTINIYIRINRRALLNLPVQMILKHISFHQDMLKD